MLHFSGAGSEVVSDLGSRKRGTIAIEDIVYELTVERLSHGSVGRKTNRYAHCFFLRPLDPLPYKPRRG